MTEVREYKVVVLEEATKEMMEKSQYKKVYQYGAEDDVMNECDEIDKKLEKIREWKSIKSKCNGGFKNRKQEKLRY